VEVAERALGIALAHRDRGVVALDVAGDERAVASSPAFAPVFARARREGLRVTAHAGEGAGPESVAAAFDLYGVRRIGHGTRSAEDPALLARLAREGAVLEVCPTSNERLGVVPSVREHPVRRFLEAGVRCVVSSDDPSLFGTDLVREYERLHLEAGVPLEALAEMAAAGFEAAFLASPGGAAGDALAAHAREARAWRPVATGGALGGTIPG
jgi:adenosine deaminase